jgi:uncharacterized membrane protein YGL010W
MLVTSFTKHCIPRLHVTDHLAVYTSFHQSTLNKRLHTIFLPCIVFSVVNVLAYLGVHSSLHVYHLGTLVSLMAVVVISTIDIIGALCMLGWLIPICMFSGYVVYTYSPFIVIPSSVVLFMVSYYATVKYGHFKIEPALHLPTGQEDSNYYFRKGYVFSQGLHPNAGFADGLVQFCISPLAFTHDWLVLLGMRKKMEKKIIHKREHFIRRLSQGEQPLVVIGG